MITNGAGQLQFGDTIRRFFVQNFLEQADRLLILVVIEISSPQLQLQIPVLGILLCSILQQANGLRVVLLLQSSPSRLEHLFRGRVRL